MTDDVVAIGDAQPAQDTSGQKVSGESEAIEGLEKMIVMGDEPVSDQALEKPAKTEEPDEDDATADADAEDSEGDDVEAGNDESEGGDDVSEEQKVQAGHRAEKRINKLTAQRNEAREKLDAAEARLKELESVATSQVELPAEYLSQTERTAIQGANALIERKEFLMQHIGVGYEDEKDESKSMSARQVAQELVRVDRMWEQVVDARRLYAERKKQMLEDLRAGRTLRLSKQALNKKKPAPAVKTTTPSQTAARPAAVANTPRRGQNAERFAKAGRSEDAAIRELEELIG